MKSTASFAEIQERRRKLFSIGITVGLYSLAFGAGILFGILSPQEQAFSNVTILVNLPGPEAPEPGLGSLHSSAVSEEKLAQEAPAPVKTASKDTKVEAPKAKSSEKPVEKTAPATKTASAAQPAATAPTPGDLPQTGAPGMVQETPQANPVPEEPWKPGARGPGSRVSASNSSVLVPGQGEVPWAEGNSVTIHKAEKGFASDTTLGGAQGTVGHNIYVPVYWSLPLPSVVSASIYNGIPDLVQPPNTVIYTAQARKRAFSKYYEYDGASYRLRADVPLDQREPLWQILEDGGYNPASADYKQGRTLMPVVIGFTVTKDKQLRGVEILQSSGDAEMDRSVLYGFKRASFWNKTGETVPGRFTYRF